MPDDPQGAVSFGKMTPNAECFTLLFPISAQEAMPYNNERAIINGIHQSLASDQALVEVKAGRTQSGKSFVYSIIKTKLKPCGVQYFCRINVNEETDTININSFFSEYGTTGQRDATIYEVCVRNDFDMSKWFADPYDSDFKHPFLKNKSEDEQFDEFFPEHPLSQARLLIKTNN